MKKTSTSTTGLTATHAGRRRTPAPAISTIAFLRQFARAYSPAPRPSMPGIILN